MYEGNTEIIEIFKKGEKKRDKRIIEMTRVEETLPVDDVKS